MFGLMESPFLSGGISDWNDYSIHGLGVFVESRPILITFLSIAIQVYLVPFRFAFGRPKQQGRFDQISISP